MENRLWRVSDNTYKLEPLTDQLVKTVEDKFEVKFPKSYLRILFEQNGGSIIYDSFPTAIPTSWADDHIHIDHIKGIGEENGVSESSYFIKEWGLPEGIILFSGDGHSWIALDYRVTKEEPPIIYIDTDSNLIMTLAPNFEAFLTCLYKNNEVDEEEYASVPERKWTLEEIKSAFASEDEFEICYALDNLSLFPDYRQHILEKALPALLQNEKLAIKENAANYAHHFNENGQLSPKCVKNIVMIILKDTEIAYYADMFFGGDV
ncbi:SMI1/KNR4 family protein [Bacillus sp. F19]|nr:SMI1/KNR4 family protein [Bacillus sp. F19]